MKRIVCALLAFMMLSLPALHARPAVLDAIKPITIIDMQNPFGPRINACTAAYINKQMHYWLTAEHCIPTFNFPPHMIDEEYFTVVMRDEVNDIAILKTRKASAKRVLPLSLQAPDYTEPVMIAGYPMGMIDAMMAVGTVSNPSGRFTHDTPRPFMVLNITGARGNSGAPVVHVKSGMLVGVIQMGWVEHSFSPMMGGATWEMLNSYRQYWDETH